MGDTSLKINVDSLITYCDDLVGVLKNKKDINSLMQSIEGIKSLESSSEADLSEVRNSLEVFQKKIDECKQRINEAKSEAIDDADLESLQKELEEELRKEYSLKEELRTISDMINNIERERISVEERKQILKKIVKDDFKEQRKLSMYASVTNLIPQLNDGTTISGHIVEREKKRVEKFEYDPANASPLEICNSLWKLMDL